MTESSSTGAKPSKRAGALIYVVDDEAMLLELAAAILEPMGYSIRTFRDPEMALQEFISARVRPDLLVTDYAMHNMNGMELMERFRKLEPRQKILLVSGTVAEDIFLDSEMKPNRFLAKPYHAEQFIRLVEELLDQP